MRQCDALIPVTAQFACNVIKIKTLSIVALVAATAISLAAASPTPEDEAGDPVLVDTIVTNCESLKPGETFNAPAPSTFSVTNTSPPVGNGSTPKVTICIGSDANGDPTYDVKGQRTATYDVTGLTQGDTVTVGTNQFVNVTGEAGTVTNVNSGHGTIVSSGGITHSAPSGTNTTVTPTNGPPPPAAPYPF